ncbi:MAG: PAS domain-containing protein [Candidatus Omnitrophica bacterium]|nr:PAS domain-containing protein [Candidatus Omnitrophota bacterium]
MIQSLRKMLKRLLFSYMLVIFFGLLSLLWILHIPVVNPFILLLMSFVLALCVILVTRFFYINPILLMSDVTQRIKNGDFSRRLNIHYHNELGDLVRNLNEMSEVLQNQIQTITNDKNEVQAILSSLVEGVVVINADGKVMYLSPNFCDLLDVRSRDANGRLYWEVIRNQEINDSIKEAIAHKIAVKKNIDVIGPQDVYFSMQVSPVMNDEKNLLSVVAIFHDITELKKFERLRSEFVANVSHELKTPLTSIKGFVETLQGGALKDPENAKRFLDIIDKQTGRLENLVNDLLTLSSLESQEMPMDYRQEGVDKILSSVIHLHKSQLERGGHNLDVQISSDLPLVHVDRQRIEQVFLNLLDNAVKFTPQGGRILVHALRDGDFIRVDIRDNGIGIASEHIPRLFERFYRVDKARSRELGGTGLGLAIVKHIVSAHRGKVSVASKIGDGSTFSVFLPVNFI